MPIIQVMANRKTGTRRDNPAQLRLWMNRNRCQRPRQPLREQQTEMSPRPHVAHDHDPAQAFVEKVAQRPVIGDRQNRVGQEFDFAALLGDEAAHQQIVGRTVFDCS
jgi:hypothetical protein